MPNAPAAQNAIQGIDQREIRVVAAMGMGDEGWAISDIHHQTVGRVIYGILSPGYAGIDDIQNYDIREGD